MALGERTGGRWSRRLFDWTPEGGGRKIGHPQRRWADEISEFMASTFGTNGSWKEAAKDRAAARKKVPKKVPKKQPKKSEETKSTESKERTRPSRGEKRKARKRRLRKRGRKGQKTTRKSLDRGNNETTP